jgi:TRAP-type C4-dicarboxylate transport system permease small subunit
MAFYPRLRQGFERLLEAVVIVLMLSLATIVVLGVGFRKSGASLVWYDEVASILLAWITYYGSALAALKGSHIGVSAVVDAMPLRLRRAAIVFAEVCVISFFILLAWVGWTVIGVLGDDYLISLPSVPVSVAQSVIPIGAVLYVIAQLIRLPEVLRRS